MIILFIFSAMVYQSGDTLIFAIEDSIIDKWILEQDVEYTDSSEIAVVRRAKISPNSRLFFIHQEKCEGFYILESTISFYDADKNLLWEDPGDTNRLISFDLSKVYDSLLIVVEINRKGKEPLLYTVRDGEKDTIIEIGQWERVVSYELSPNYRYLASNTRNVWAKKRWNYIYSVDLELKKDWSYLLPICVSCRKPYPVEVSVSDSGVVDVMTGKGEHRIFSKEGRLIDVFMKIE